MQNYNNDNSDCNNNRNEIKRGVGEKAKKSLTMQPRERRQNVSGQISDSWPPRGEGVKRNPLSFTSEGLLLETLFDY